MKDKITVLIPTSPIPSHPSTAILDETIYNIRKYTDARIIIMFDGVHKSLANREIDYGVYKSHVEQNIKLGKYGDCTSIWFPVHNHQAMMTKYVIANHVSTPLIMFCEHDTSPIGDIPFDKICDFIEQDPDVNYMRFNFFESIPKEHDYLMISNPIIWTPKEFDDLELQNFSITAERQNKIIRDHGIRFMRTIQWSQRPHIAKTLWYNKLLNTHFHITPISMIEDVMHSVVQTSFQETGMDLFGLTIYTPEGNQLRSYHSDGRGDDQKIITG
jgi:hypothetical protein